MTIVKTIIILGDGMADEPILSLNNKTILQAAHTPWMDLLAAKGKNGLLETIPQGYHPGSEIANLSVLGYNLSQVFEGRGVLEAASMGVYIEDDEMAMRCNLICIENNLIKNHSAGHISTQESTELIAFLQEKLGNDMFSFYAGVSYRHLFKMKGGNKSLITTPPHDVTGVPFRDVMIKSSSSSAQYTADALNELTLKSHELLTNHPINKQRRAQGKDVANSIWLWSAGYRPQMNTLQNIYGVKKGAVISAVDLIRGIGVYAGLDIIEVEGITGLYDTNYEGKAAAALEALKTCDFVYLHIEASDEAGHEGDVELKIKTVENLDSRIVKTIYEGLQNQTAPFTIAVLPDHPTPCYLKTHTNAPVPFIIYRSQGSADHVVNYSEEAASEGEYGLLKKDEFMKLLFKPLA